MSVQSEIDRIKGNISESYSAAEQMGADLPAADSQNSSNLAATIRSIPSGGGQSFNPNFDGLVGRNGFRVSYLFPDNKVIETITIVSNSEILATRTTLFKGNTVVIVTDFQEQTFLIDGVEITTIATTDSVTFDLSTMILE